MLVGLTDTSADVRSVSLGKHAKLVSCYVINFSINKQFAISHFYMTPSLSKIQS